MPDVSIRCEARVLLGVLAATTLLAAPPASARDALGTATMLFSRDPRLAEPVPVEADATFSEGASSSPSGVLVRIQFPVVGETAVGVLVLDLARAQNSSVAGVASEGTTGTALYYEVARDGTTVRTGGTVSGEVRLTEWSPPGTALQCIVQFDLDVQVSPPGPDGAALRVLADGVAGTWVASGGWQPDPPAVPVGGPTEPVGVGGGGGDGVGVAVDVAVDVTSDCASDPSDAPVDASDASCDSGDSGDWSDDSGDSGCDSGDSGDWSDDSGDSGCDGGDSGGGGGSYEYDSGSTGCEGDDSTSADSSGDDGGGFDCEGDTDSSDEGLFAARPRRPGRGVSRAAPLGLLPLLVLGLRLWTRRRVSGTDT